MRLLVNKTGLLKLRQRRQRERLKRNRFYEQNKYPARASGFLYISLPSLHVYVKKWPNFELTWERERQVISELDRGLLSFAAPI